jgi:hypothetical protein
MFKSKTKIARLDRDFVSIRNESRALRIVRVIARTQSAYQSSSRECLSLLFESKSKLRLAHIIESPQRKSGDMFMTMTMLNSLTRRRPSANRRVAHERR